MSSNIKVQRICKLCGVEFTARTTVTQYCGDNCAKRAYKLRQKEAKIDQSNIETAAVKDQKLESIKEKEFLSVNDVTQLLGCCRQTVYSLINSGKLKAVNIKVKKTIIPRTALDKLFEL